MYGANFADEIGALEDHDYDCVIGTTPLCAHAKELGIPSIYYTNAMATRSQMFAEGASDILSLVMSTYRSKERYHKIASFFSETGVPQRTQTSWAPKIDLPEHLLANEAFVTKSRDPNSAPNGVTAL